MPKARAPSKTTTSASSPSSRVSSPPLNRKDNLAEVTELASIFGNSTVLFRLDDGSNIAVDSGFIREIPSLRGSLSGESKQDFSVPGVSSTVIKLFLVWLYRRPQVEDGAVPFTWTIKDQDMFVSYIHLGLLAERWGIDELKDMVEELLKHWINDTCHYLDDEAVMAEAYRIAKRSSLRWIIVRKVVIARLVETDGAHARHKPSSVEEHTAFQADMDEYLLRKLHVCFYEGSKSSYEDFLEDDLMAEHQEIWD